MDYVDLKDFFDSFRDGITDELSEEPNRTFFSTNMESELYISGRYLGAVITAKIKNHA